MRIERPVEFSSEGATLRGLLLRPAEASGPLPTVLMAHGTSATIQMVAIDHARAFARRGLQVLLYDHRNLGRSGGEPRQQINPWVQCRGYLDAIGFAATLPDVDATRLALWGDSYSAAEVIVVAACDARPRAVVAQCPVFGASLRSLPATPVVFETLRAQLLQGDVQGTAADTTGPLPVVSFDQHSCPSLLTPIQAFRWFIDFGGRPGSGWVNRVTRVLPALLVPFQAGLCTPFVRQPVLMMVAPDDEMPHCNPGVARAAFEQLPGPRRWCEIGGGHFGPLYPGTETFEHAVSVQADFLLEVLASL
jgi:pimeloyl-ACP methyl ester carboxylesterase